MTIGETLLLLTPVFAMMLFSACAGRGSIGHYLRQLWSNIRGAR